MAEEAKTEENTEIQVKLDASPNGRASYGASASSLDTRLKKYTGINPFTRRPLTLYAKIRICFFLISGIFLVKIILLVICLLLVALCAFLATCCRGDVPPNTPLPASRKWLVGIMRFLMRFVLFLFGFYWISVEKEDPSSKIPVMVVANHHTAWDGFILFAKYGCTAAAKQDLRAIPVVGRIGDALNVIWIDRVSKNGRKKAIQQIKDHASLPNNRKLMVFPQGMCTSITTLTSFKAGAFIPGVPVQPIALNYFGNTITDLSWTTAGMGREFLIAGCSFINFAKIHMLKPYNPNANEKADAKLFGRNVREVILKGLPEEVTATRHQFEDMLLGHKARKNVPGFNTASIMMSDVFTNLEMKVNTVTKLIKVFDKLDTNHDGVIDYLEFCAAFNRSPSQRNMHKLFNLFKFEGNSNENKDENDGDDDDEKSEERYVIEFEDFLSGVSVIYVNSRVDDAMRIFFDGMDVDGDGFIVEENPRHILMTAQDEFAKAVSKGIAVDASDSKGDKKKKDDGGQPSSGDLVSRFNALREALGVPFEDSEFDSFFSSVFKDESEKIDFDTFCQRVKQSQSENVVQIFLQFIVGTRLGIRLDASDFANSDRVTAEWVKAPTGNLAMLSDLMRATSVRNVTE